MYLVAFISRIQLERLIFLCKQGLQRKFVELGDVRKFLRWVSAPVVYFAFDISNFRVVNGDLHGENFALLCEIRSRYFLGG